MWPLHYYDSMWLLICASTYIVIFLLYIHIYCLLMLTIFSQEVFFISIFSTCLNNNSNNKIVFYLCLLISIIIIICDWLLQNTKKKKKKVYGFIWCLIKILTIKYNCNKIKKEKKRERETISEAVSVRVNNCIDLSTHFCIHIFCMLLWW